ncbi:sulfate permease [Podospora aff. communis PSN243]|uniref:Sulfate permease n=1 Tax=Podospora aff. communis PSN243 TaxID=3040156 RepID=A0AAV9H0B2_9PEZI|nr:sulfate permease [Podospora aff. communis PSN243]
MSSIKTPDEKPGAGDSGSPETAETKASIPNKPTYPNTLSRFLICLGLFLSVLCFGLDPTIITTAVAKITSDFNALEHRLLIFGKLYSELDMKWLYLAALAIFEAGSVICAAAPNSASLIIGRAIAGLGAAGMITGVFLIIEHIAPLQSRPKITGMVGGAMGIAQVVVNLPRGAVTFVAVFVLVNVPKSDALADSKKTEYQRLAGIIRRFDLLGTVVLLPAIVSLLLALQWGGTEYAWGFWRVITTLVVFGVATLVWVGIQYRAGDDATVPLRIIRGRSIISAMWFIFCIIAVLVIFVQYVTIWSQARLGVSAYQSGINLLAATVSMSVTFIAAGFLTSKIGYYVPPIIASTIITCISCGLITRFNLDTARAYWIPSLLLLTGIGIGAQQPFTIPQTVLIGPDISLGTSIIIFSQTLSGTIFISIANNIFYPPTRLRAHEPSSCRGSRGCSLGRYPGEIEGLLEAYAATLGKVWIVMVVMACLSIFGVVFPEWRSVK